MPKLRHYDKFGTARFITFCCFHRYQLLNDKFARKALIDNLTKMRDYHKIKLYGYVIMPEHLHLVLHPPDNLELGRIIGQLKARIARETLARIRDRQPRLLEKLHSKRGVEDIYSFWQRRCYDHNCRSSDKVVEKIEYCHKNPVVRGLVTSPGDWLWSSYNYYMGADDVPIRMDSLE